MESRAKGKKDNGQAMTRIDKTQHKKLKDLSKKFDLTQTDFLNYAVDYFSKTGINPGEKIFSPREEIAKLDKRLTQVIQWWRAFERDNTKPIFEELTKLYQSLKIMLPKLDQSGQWSAWATTFNTFTEALKKRNNQIESEQSTIKMEIQEIQKQQEIHSQQLNRIIEYLESMKEIQKKFK